MLEHVREKKKNRPRVGVFTRPIDKGTSGSGHHLHEILRHVLELNKEFEIILIHYEKNDTDIYRSAPEIIIPRNPLRAAAVLKSFDFDVLHYNPLTIFAPMLGLKAAKCATIHGAEPNIVPRYYNLTTRLHARAVKPFLARRMDRIFTVSRTSKDYYVRNWGVRPERVSICYNSVSNAYRRLGTETEIRKKYAISGRHIFHVSKYSPRKNPECILRGFAELAADSDFSDLSLVLSGSGWENDYTRSLVGELGLKKRVVCTGFTPEEDVVALFNEAEAFVFPSRAEGFGMPNIEAMACGCPVVTSSSFAIPEIVGDAAQLMEDADDYHDLAQKVRALLKNPSLRDDYVQKGLARAACYSWTTSAETVLSGYRDLIR
ncbi:glycosyltransferase family 1 protein [Marispirochaeta sp.]|uniref:glycosyltransferase family 4 protein n=1 Tax=Marispirochaeta sp. TaxID=2038653 RepID=UPI0029C813A6|nr:glycosyltransferase family 1 protein [Marispirochaeta sp.]